MSAWNDGPSLSVEQPIHGMICNRHDGDMTASGPFDVALRPRAQGRVARGREPVERLRIPVIGKASGNVIVNGNSVPVKDGRFETAVTLTQRENEIVVVAGAHGENVEERLTVLYDQNSFPRARFSLDDNILFLRDIAKNAGTYRSIFDNGFLGFFRTLHRRYGARFHFNIYFEDVCFFKDFTLEQMTDKFKSEWRENADWIRLTFHAMRDQPDKPYIDTDYATMRRDATRVTEQIIRFAGLPVGKAGEECLSTFTTVHWGECTLAGCRALHDLGFRGLVGYFEEQNGKPFVSYYLDSFRQRHLSGRDYWKDISEDLIFVKHDMVVNMVKLGDIAPNLDALFADKHRSEILELMIHEQYFHKEFGEYYEADAKERVEAAVRWATEHNYKWVFYDEGFVGA